MGKLTKPIWPKPSEFCGHCERPMKQNKTCKCVYFGYGLLIFFLVAIVGMVVIVLFRLNGIDIPIE